MRKLGYLKLARPEYKDQCIILQQQLKDEGYDVDLASVSFAWQDYSSSLCAGWMGLQTAELNVSHLLHYLSEFGGE